MLLSAGLFAASAVSAQTTMAADTLVDSVGVNLHLHYDGTLYREDFATIKDRLLELRIRHVRDGLIDTTWKDYYNRFNELGEAGIKGIFIVAPDVGSDTLRQYPSRMSSSFEGYEAPNEWNQSGDPNWAATLRSTLARLHALKSIPAVAHFPIYGPSLTKKSAYAALGNISSLVDAGNLHNYFDGRHPGTTGWGADGYGSLDWHFRNIRPYIGKKPIVSTETGYMDDSMSALGALPDEVIAKYLPRLVLEQLRRGVSRTFLYELVDFPVPNVAFTSAYGLLRSNGSYKPAFKALSGLMALLEDRGTAFPITPLNYAVSGTAVSGTNESVRHMAFQKRDGSYYLAVWIEKPAFDVATKTFTPVPVDSFTLTLPPALHAVAQHRWTSTGAVVHTELADRSAAVTLPIDDWLSVFEIRDLAPSAPTNVKSNRTY